MLLSQTEITTLLNHSQNLKNKIYDLFKEHADTFDLPILQLLVIFSLGNGEVHSVKEIANQFMLQATNTSSLCKKMSHDGLIQRKRDSKDVRVVNITLTDKGKALYDTVSSRLEEKITHISPKQVDIQKITAGLKELDKLFSLLGENNAKI